MAQHYGLVDFRLPEPGALLAAGENLDGDVFAAPLASPHLTEATLADDLDELDLARYGPLDQEGETGCK